MQIVNSEANNIVQDVNETRWENIVVFFIFLISPFLVLIFSLINFQSKWSKNGLWAFVVFFGFTMVIFSEGLDSYQYLQDLKFKI